MSISMSEITTLTAMKPDPGTKEQQKALGAAKDFESLLLAQMLRSVREEGSGWLGTDEDDASAPALGLGEEQLARALTQAGGLGLSKVIAKGLEAKAAAAASALPDSAQANPVQPSPVQPEPAS